MKQANIGFVALFASDTDKLEKFRNHLAKKQEEIIEDRYNSMEGSILNAIYQLQNDGKEDIDCQHIIEKGNIKNSKGIQIQPRTVSNILKTLGFKQSESRKVEGKTKRCIPLDKEHIQRLYKSYGVTQVTEDTNTPLLMDNNTNLGDNLCNHRNNRNQRNSEDEIKPEVIDMRKSEKDELSKQSKDSEEK